MPTLSRHYVFPQILAQPSSIYSKQTLCFIIDSGPTWPFIEQALFYHRFWLTSLYWEVLFFSTDSGSTYAKAFTIPPTLLTVLQMLQLVGGRPRVRWTHSDWYRHSTSPWQVSEKDSYVPRVNTSLLYTYKKINVIMESAKWLYHNTQKGKGLESADSFRSV